jgi:hypothetical protein
MMKTHSLPFLAAFLLLSIAHGSLAANDGHLSIAVAQHSITVSGLTPGSAALFFGVAQVPIPHAYMNRVQRWAITVDDINHTGTVTLDLPQEVPRASVWAVVDLRNAHYATASSPGGSLRETTLDNPLRKGPSLSAERFAFDHGYLELLYVHPGTGAWTWSAIAGTTADNRGPTGSTVVSLADGKAIGTPSSKPLSFLPGGILVAVDFTRLEIAVVSVDEQLIRGAR